MNLQIATRYVEHLREKNPNVVIGYTSGAFDLLHAGHINYLVQAASICDRLIIGLNSDKSIKQYKSKDRPIIPEEERLEVLQALKPVSFVFLFDEPNNHNNITTLKPDIYIKGGNYTARQLTSQSLVEEYGGRIELIEVAHKTSTTQIINQIEARYISESLGQKHVYSGIVFIDRDGVINEDIGYILSTNDFKMLPNVPEAIKIFNKYNLAVVMISNQPGIDLNMTSSDQVHRIHAKMLSELNKHSAKIDRIYFCPNTHKNSMFKKPNPGMLNEAIKWFTTKPGSPRFMIGDRRSDSLAAINADPNIITIGVETGYGCKDTWINHYPKYTVSDILVAAHLITEEIIDKCPNFR